MTVTPPEPLPPAQPSDVAPASPYATVPASPVYAPAPVDPSRDKNPFGIAALIIMIVALLIPVGFLLAPIVISIASGGQTGWAILGGLVFAFIGLVPAAGLGLVAIVLAIVSLVRSNRKAPGIIALVLGSPLVLLGLAMFPAFINGQF